jgi:hypothetical protein
MILAPLEFRREGDGMSFPKRGKVLPRAPRRDPKLAYRYARLIARALHGALGDTHPAVKTIMRWTGAHERTAKMWLSGKSGPSGEYLIELIRHCEAVLEALLMAADRSNADNATIA